jgi:protein-disulfide isomerase
VARAAANAAACAQRESAAAFWTLHDALYREQDMIQVGGLAKWAARTVGESLGARLGEYQGCLTKEEGESIVERDLALGRALRVTSTPTIFINGARVPALGSAEDLAAYIRQALRGREARHASQAQQR